MFLTCEQVLPHIERRGKSVIVNITSVSGGRQCYGPMETGFPRTRIGARA
jgi:NAD(P)-dependent dehydrogenase (short-subunit alcohol dehydrogenase family)